MTEKDTNHWQGKERIQTIDKEEYKPLAGKERIQTIDSEGYKQLAG